jgi:hypothetical protein
MKKLILPATYLFGFTLLFCSLSVNAQGVNQIWGTTKAGGRDNMGVIFQCRNQNSSNKRRFFSPPAGGPGANSTRCFVTYKWDVYSKNN